MTNAISYIFYIFHLLFHHFFYNDVIQQKTQKWAQMINQKINC